MVQTYVYISIMNFFPIHDFPAQCNGSYAHFKEMIDNSEKGTKIIKMVIIIIL